MALVVRETALAVAKPTPTKVRFAAADDLPATAKRRSKKAEAAEAAERRQRLAELLETAASLETVQGNAFAAEAEYKRALRRQFFRLRCHLNSQRLQLQSPRP